MGWLGDPSSGPAEYFRTSPEDVLWSLDGTRQRRAHFHTLSKRCNVVEGLQFDWCKTHWIPLFHSNGTELVQAPILPVACEHCSARWPSKGELKKHMHKAHRDVLESQRAAHERQKLS